MLWLAVAGIGLQIAGLSLAARGLALTYRVAVPGGQIARDTISALWRWFSLSVLRRRPKRVIAATTGTATATSSASGYATVRPKVPADDAPEHEQIAYLRRTVERLEADIAESQRRATQGLARLESRLSSELEAVSDRVEHASDALVQMRIAIWGTNGDGLRLAAVGLVLTIAGVALTLFGLNW